MRWDLIQAGLFDELAKIAEISLAGLAPETVMGSGRPAPPMETSGLSKAIGILDRALVSEQKSKTAAPQVPFNPSLPSINTVTRRRKGKKGPPDVVDRGKSLAGHTLGGMGIGRLAGEMAHGPRAPVSEAAKQALHGKRWYGAAIGGAVGAGEFVRKRIAEARNREKEKTSNIAAVSSPKVALQASRSVARHSALPRTSGPSLRTQLGGSVIGRKFIPPGA